MISFDPCFLVGESVSRKKNRIIRRILAGKMCRSIFLITDPYNKENTFDIIEAKMLMFSYMQERHITIYALAGSNSEAKELLLSLVEKKYVCS